MDSNTQESIDQETQQDHRFAADNSSLVLLGSAALQVFTGFFSLAWLELKQAVKTVPKLIALGAVLACLSFFAWIAFSISVGWVVYHFTGYSVLAPISIFLVQVAAIGLCMLLSRHYKKKVSFSNTKNEWHHIQELAHEFKQADNRTAQAPS